MTDTPTTTELVLASRQGDTSAFATLITRHARAAQAYASARLGDAPTAEDAVQDAFVDAWRLLPQLREPAAFPGWFRRCVHKHCDRHARKQRATAPLPAQIAAALPAAPTALLHAEARLRLRRAIEALPVHQRQCVAMHHLGGVPVAEIAAFLELSASAVKKRLFDARARLSHTPEAIMSPPRPDHLDPIALFLAVRAGDATAVRSILARRPELLEAEEAWADQDALDGGFSLAHPLTPLVLAAGYGDVAMVDLLLSLGADPTGACSCDNGESAVWAAARAGHDDAVARLEAAGATLDGPAGAGWTVHDLKRWRATPPTPAPQMEAHTTGIRAVDLWLSWRPNDVVCVHGAAETGLTVLLAELTLAFAEQGWATHWTSWEVHPWHRRELEVLARRYALPADLVLHTGADDGVLDRAREAVAATDRPILHVVFDQEGRSAALEAALPRLGSAATLTLVVRPWRQVTAGTLPPPTGAPWDGAVVTDPRLAGRGIYPAIHPTQTWSRHAHPSAAVTEARSLAEAALAGDDDPQGRGERVLVSLTQPFHVAAPDTGWPGVRVGAGELWREVGAIVAGEHDGEPLTEWRYRGR